MRRMVLPDTTTLRIPPGWVLQALLAIASHLLAFALILVLFKVDEFSTMELYFRYGTLLHDGQVPYRDFILEYPPLAMPLLWLPRAFGPDLATYRIAFALEMLAIDICGIAIALHATRRYGLGWRGWGVVLVQPLWLVAAGRSLVFERFDLAPAVLVLLAIMLIASRHTQVGWMVLGLATAIKLYPLVIAPLCLLPAGRRPWHRLAADLAAYGAAILLPALAITRGNAGALATFFRYHLDRGLEIETIYASAILVAQRFGYPARVVYEHGGTEIVAAVAPGLAALSLPLTVAGLVAVYAAAWRGRTSPTTDGERVVFLLEWAGGASLVFILAGKVLSPQFLLWLYPLLPLVDKRRWPAWSMFGLALLLSRWLYPDHWLELVSFRWHAIVVLLVRNGLLMAVGVLLTVPPRRTRTRRTREADSITPKVVVSAAPGRGARNAMVSCSAEARSRSCPLCAGGMANGHAQ